MSDEIRKGVLVPIEYKVLRKPPLFCINLWIRYDVFRVDNNSIKPCLQGIIQKHRIDNFSCIGWQPKANIAEAKGSKCAREFLLDKSDSLKRIFCRISKFCLACSKCKGENIKDELPWFKIIFLACFIQQLRSSHLFFCRLSHPIWSDAHGYCR